MNESSSARGVTAYAKTGLESQVIGATPQQLITLLFDGANNSIRQARVHMQQGNMQGKGNAISRALDIINRGLVAGLDMEAGGEIAANLALMYDYITRRLVEANATNDEATLDEAAKLLDEIGSAWRQMEAQ